MINEMEYQNLQSIKKLTIVLLLSLFSFLFSYTYFYYKYFYFVAFPFQILNHIAGDKNYIFLICNGILLLLTKTSGMVNILLSPSDFDLNEFSKTYSEVLLESSSSALSECKEEEEEITKFEILDDNKQLEASKEIVEVDENGIFTNNIEEENEEEKAEGGKEVVEESDDEPLNKLSIEELNKIFEEFIKRMKQEIRVDVHEQQLVPVK
ncbi:uncharacterized protein LOC132626623 [Lycium barbarum]|uniref:uncharacterized protein LOC132626623 n=1 Tax=Lycium barbarum TaxID=112863 RepID=UPI00293F0DD5|nr:uncharacterized protein LOC132626623 [Lycium barbarum]